MASAGERCHISVWLSESFCILNPVRQGFNFIALLRGEGEDATYKELASHTGEASVAGRARGPQGRSCPERAAAEGSTAPAGTPGYIQGCKSCCRQDITRLMRVR